MQPIEIILLWCLLIGFVLGIGVSVSIMVYQYQVMDGEADTKRIRIIEKAEFAAIATFEVCFCLFIAFCVVKRASL